MKTAELSSYIGFKIKQSGQFSRSLSDFLVIRLFGK